MQANQAMTRATIGEQRELEAANNMSNKLQPSLSYRTPLSPEWRIFEVVISPRETEDNDDLIIYLFCFKNKDGPIQNPSLSHLFYFHTYILRWFYR